MRKEDTKRKEVPHILKETKQRERNIPEDRCEDLGRKADPKVKGGLSPASASCWIIDFDLSEPAALHFSVTEFL